MHAAIAVHTAHQDGTPLILAIGQVARAHRGRKTLQEIDCRAVFASTAKLVVEIDDADRVPEIVARAAHVAISGRPGPVVIVLPEEVFYERTEAALVGIPRGHCCSAVAGRGSRSRAPAEKYDAPPEHRRRFFHTPTRSHHRS
jgi:thiamine pyrophosphate-dependent acetolactate synthase large subunit-like protein